MSFITWLLLSFLFCSSLSLQNPTQTCHPLDLLALKEFAANFTDGSILSSWSNDSMCCNWDGVICENGENGAKNQSELQNRVTILNLSSKGLKGLIPNSLFRLQKLKSLDLSFNHFEGGLPKNVYSLKELQVLNLSSNFFNGDLSQIGVLPSLIAFNLSNNSFSGNLHPQICTSSMALRVLDLSMNHFNGGLEGLINCNKSLQQLHLDFNSFSGVFPEVFYSISSLEHITLSVNNFSGQINAKIGNLSNLKSLVLSANHFEGSIPNVFDNLPNLEQLSLHSNSFSGPLPSTLESCSSLRDLDLRNNSLSGSLSMNFTKLPNLITLDLATNRFTGPLPNSLSNCLNLKILSLAKNELSGEIPISYTNLSSLSFLSLSNNSFTNLSQALTILQNCKYISTLILTRNFHGEEMARNINGFQNLTVFAIGNCAIKGLIPAWLLNSPKLEVLDLSWNRLNGVIPPWINRLERLFYLDLSNNSLSGEFPKSLTELKSLISLNNSSILTLSTGIPLYVKRNLTTTGLQYNQASSFPPSIYLSNNEINGTIPVNIGKLKQLHVLDLSKNNITGMIPSTISEMENLEVLDLSSNYLYGSIPGSFNKLTFLSRFSVANNHLQGSIPTGTQFSGFPSSSFDGNSGLCGQMVSPCSVNVTGLRPIQTHSDRKFGRNSILGITLGIGAGLAILLAFVVLIISRKEHDHLIDHFNDENNTRNPLSGTFQASKLVLFQTAGYKDLTVQDLLKSTNNFSQTNIIGCGGFGLVYKADLPDGSKAAIKRLSGDSGQMEREFRAEVEALSKAQHKNLVLLKGYCKHETDILLIYSYMENGSLDYWLHERVNHEGSLGWTTRLNIAKGAARGLAYLHNEPNIIHRDIKTSNILLNEKFEAHLADFGLSRLLCPYDTHVTTDLVGTLGYIPPEYGQTLTVTFRGDVYSFGVVLLELVTGRRPVEVVKGKSCRDLVSWVFRMRFEGRETEVFDSSIFDKSCEKEMMEVLSVSFKCLDEDPRRRPCIEEVVSWLDGVGEIRE